MSLSTVVVTGALSYAIKLYHLDRIHIFLPVQFTLFFSRVLEVLVSSLAPSENVYWLMMELLCWNIGHFSWSTILHFLQRKWIVSINSVISYLWQIIIIIIIIIITWIQIWIFLSSEDTRLVILRARTHARAAYQISTLCQVKKQNFKNYIFFFKRHILLQYCKWTLFVQQNVCLACINHIPSVTPNTWLSKCLTCQCWSDDGHMGHVLQGPWFPVVSDMVKRILCSFHHFNSYCSNRSQVRAISIVTRLQAVQSGFSSGRSKKCFSPPKHPDWLWGPSSLVFKLFPPRLK
jgi:hypothetical protein